MSQDKPTIPVGDIARGLKLPGWLRWVLDLFRGTKIHAGPVDIQLDQAPGATPPRTGLDQPHQIRAPKVGPPR
jgi:hypothetical protein